MKGYHAYTYAYDAISLKNSETTTTCRPTYSTLDFAVSF